METLGKGHYLELLRVNGWEYVRRTASTSVVVIIAQTDANELLLVEQYRQPVGTNVIELPAGLVGDEPRYEQESPEQAAKRELVEETGYLGTNFELLLESPSSSGLSSEIISIYRATQIEKQHVGGGNEHEDIIVHAIPVGQIKEWLKMQLQNKKMIDYKIYLALYFLS